jgi:dihydroorotase
MRILVRQAIIKDTNSPHNNKVKDIYIENGQIVAIAEQLSVEADTIIEYPGLHVSPGWIDVFVTGTDPGYEFKDTLETTAASAATGGFTHIFLTPNTKPIVQNKTSIDYILGRHVHAPVQFHPIGAITKNTDGAELTEMYEMEKHGAVAFGDGTKAVQSAGILIKALQYVNAFKGIVMQIPDDRSIAPHGLMNEGLVSTQVGLPGKPAIAEELMIARDITLAKYTGSRLHITGISLASSVDMIKKAKKEGVDITCSCTPYHLLFTEEDLLRDYDTNLKVNPPLRTTSDREALLLGVRDGTIDCITTHHTAQHKDAKICEFEYAGYGTLGLASCFGLLNNLKLDIDNILRTICFKPKELFDIKGNIEVGSLSDLTLFLADTNLWRYEKDCDSLSSNNAFAMCDLRGKVIGTILKEKLNINSMS